MQHSVEFSRIIITIENYTDGTILSRAVFNKRALSPPLFFFFFSFRSKKHTSTISLQFNCCGIHGYGDYNGTAWWRDAQISGNRRQVPLTCCVLKNTEVWNVYCCVRKFENHNHARFLNIFKRRFKQFSPFVI